MASLKELRNRIASVRSTQKITKAMQMVAASKLRRAQSQAEAGRPYADRMAGLMSSLVSGLVAPDDAPKLLMGSGSDDVHLIVVTSSERGLCGGFNTNIVRAARLQINELMEAGKTVKILCVGKKGRDMLKREHGELIVDTIDLSGLRQIGFDDAAPIARRLVEMFEAGEFDTCTLYYSRFVTVMTQVVTPLQLVPWGVPEAGEDEKAEDPSGRAPALTEFEPDEADILAELLPSNLAIQVYHSLLENAASEQGARMTAMDSATRNAGDMIDRLTLNYNRTRQAQITKELIEIISGAEAL